MEKKIGKTAQQKAWETIHYNDRINKRFGLKKGSFTIEKRDKYIKEFKSSENVEVILMNPHSTCKHLAKKTGMRVSEVKKFLPSAIESVVLQKPRIGTHKLSIVKPLSYLEARFVAKKKKELKKRKELAVPFSGREKECMRTAVITNVSKFSSNGEVLSLPYAFSIESRLIKIKNFNGCRFTSFEAPYNTSKSRETKRRYIEQIEFLKENPDLDKRVTMIYYNLNEFISKRNKVGSFAHILADYCGTLSSNYETIEYTLKNNLLKKKGIIWITLSARDKKGLKPTIRRIQDLLNSAGGDRYVRETVGGLEEAMEGKGKVKIKVKNIYHYGKRGCGMYTFILRRVK